KRRHVTEIDLEYTDNSHTNANTRVIRSLPLSTYSFESEVKTFDEYTRKAIVYYQIYLIGI
ncbi:unnamed protein product, partial [Rotaria magnacalcarata]